jgi:hypothetical protein
VIRKNGTHFIADANFIAGALQGGDCFMRLVFALWLLIMVGFTFAIHEAAHGFAGQALGYKTYVRVNSSGLEDGQVATDTHEQLMTAAGPAVTILQGALGLALALVFSWRGAFAIVFSALMMRILAAVASLRMPNDEARLGLSWDVGFWTVHAAVILVLLVMTYWTARRLHLTFGTVALSFLVASLAMVGVVIAEPWLPTLYL